MITSFKYLGRGPKPFFIGKIPSRTRINERKITVVVLNECKEDISNTITSLPDLGVFLKVKSASCPYLFPQH